MENLITLGRVKSSNVKTRAYQFSLVIIRFVNTLPKLQGYRTIGDQLIRASTSIGANLIEAQAASSRKDFTNYYHIALKSANESKYWIGILADTLPSHKRNAEKFLQEVTEIANMIGASILTLKKQSHEDLRF